MRDSRVRGAALDRGLAWLGVALIGAGAVVAGCAPAAPPAAPAPDTAASAAGWTELPPPPLVPRTGPVVAWTGGEALVLGGITGAPCPPTADCPVPDGAADGAALDPATRTWRPVTEAPVPIPGGRSHAVSGDAVHVVLTDRVLTYDAGEDAWSMSPPPPSAPALGELGDPAALDDGRVVLVGGERRDGDPADLVYDPATRTWAELPEDPIGPAFDRLVTAVPGGLVLTAKTLVPQPGADEPALVRAAVLDAGSDAWRLIEEEAEQIGGWRWAWTGSRLVDPTPGGADGGEVGHWGRSVPFGGALDPVAGTWAPLPPAPEDGGGWPVTALGGPVSALDGRLYDDRAGSWTRLARPPGAPETPGAAVWAGDDLLVVGGIRSDHGWGREDVDGGAWLLDLAPAPAAEVATGDLTGVRWVLEREVHDGTARPPGGAREASLTFSPDGTAEVDTGCVAGSTTWRAEGDVVALEEFGWTGQACTPDRFEAQAPLFDTLSSARPTVEGDVLTLVPTGPGATLVYRAR